MFPTQNGSIRLFRVLGIEVFLHWSWFLVAAITLSNRAELYSSPLWNIAEYLALFGIVLLHEFGHSLACRQTGGLADRIVLWPLGGVAYVAPPQRPGAQLWSIAAGPLVNVVLVPVLFGGLFALEFSGASDRWPDFAEWLFTVNIINAALLIFNLLPVYPLDGGQILRSVLWYWTGPLKSLQIAAAVGLVGGCGLAVFALSTQRWWTLLMAGFLLFHCWGTLRAVRAIAARIRAAETAVAGAPVIEVEVERRD